MRRRRRRKGDREGQEGGRVREGERKRGTEGEREGEREKRVDQNTNCFVQLHTTQNLIPRERNGMRVHTNCMPPITDHCSVCVDSCLVAAELLASHHCGCGTSVLRSGMGAYSSAKRGEDRRSDSYNWRERKGGRERRRETGMEGGKIRVY